jgi:hypothetical protein
MMFKVLSQVKHWPDNDLFKYSLPLPLKTNLSDSSSTL